MVCIDAAAGGNLRTLRKFWDLLVTHGPSYGYFPKPSKTHFVVKAEFRAAAARIFEGTGIHRTEEGDRHTHEAGQRHLGATVGSAEFVAVYLDHRITAWAKDVDQLSQVAATHPHATYAAYDFGLRHRWTFLQCTMPVLSAGSRK